MRTTARVILSAALLVAGGCAPIMVGAPGQQRTVQPVQPESGTPINPALCMGAVNDIGYYTSNHSLAHFFILLTAEHPQLTGCDLVLSLYQAGASVFHRAELQAYSAYTGELAWQGSGAGTAGVLASSILVTHLVRDFAPGMPLRRKLDEEAASGRRVTAEDLARSGMTLISEASMSAKNRELVSKIRQLAAGRVRSLAAPRAPAAVPAHAAAPAPAPRVASDLDQLPAAVPVSSKRHAVVIGVERYRESLPAADFAAGDAKLAAEYFKRVLGVPEANLVLLVDDRATKSDFEKHFERWLPNRVEKDDEVFVYFSGHGAPNPAKGDAYLVPFDGDPTYIEQTGYPLKKMYDQLARLPAKRVFVAMDSCFSGAGGRSVIAKGARPLVASVAAEVPAKVTVLAASAGDQISNSYQEKGHGLFTYFLLKGLKEKDADFKAAFDYLKPEVAKIARREYNADQDPQWREGR